MIFPCSEAAVNALKIRSPDVGSRFGVSRPGCEMADVLKGLKLILCHFMSLENIHN